MAPPQEAQAWAWKDTCTFRLNNESGAQSNVRPIVYAPLPPNPIAIATYAALAATGVPTNQKPELSTTGIPVTYGCRAALAVSNPGQNASCTAAAPTQGANTFTCSGNVSTRVYEDNDNIRGEITFRPAPAGTEEDPDEATPPPAGRGRAALRRGDLPGKGWRAAKELGQLGELGSLFEDAPSPGCGDGEPSADPKRADAAAFSRRNGTQWAGVANSVHGSPGQARAALEDAVGRESIRCLDRLLTSRKLGTTVSRRELPSSGAGASWVRLAIETDLRGKENDRTDYLDVVGVRDGARTAVLMLNRVDGPTPAGQAAQAVESVTRRLD